MQTLDKHILKSYIGFFIQLTGKGSRTKEAADELRKLRTQQGHMLDHGETSVTLLRNNRPSGNI